MVSGAEIQLYLTLAFGVLVTIYGFYTTYNLSQFVADLIRPDEPES